MFTDETAKLTQELEHQNTLLAGQDFTRDMQDQLSIQSLLLQG